MVHYKPYRDKFYHKSAKNDTHFKGRIFNMEYVHWEGIQKGVYIGEGYFDPGVGIMAMGVGIIARGVGVMAKG